MNIHQFLYHLIEHPLIFDLPQTTIFRRSAKTLASPAGFDAFS
jgi:hypothetical protein